MFQEPTFLVQVGHNGKKRATRAVEDGYADGAVLSPSDYKYKQNIDISDEIKSNEGIVLFDPQFYIPRTDRPDLSTYSYFEERGGENFSTGMFASRAEREELCRDILATQDDFGVEAYISPARFLESYTGANLDRWLDLVETFLDVAEEEGREIPVFASLPINGFELNDEERRNRLLNRITKVDPDGFYVSVQYDDLDTRLPLKGKENVHAYLDLMSSLRTNRFEVIAAHTHQIAHLLLGLGINAFASGHYQNLRAFDVDRWEPSDGDEIRQQVVRYYSEPLLNSIRVDSHLQDLYTDDDFEISKIRTESPYEEDLFEGTTSPEEAGWKFSGASWEHYIWSCGKIRSEYREMNTENRLDSPPEVVEEARNLYNDIKSDVGEIDEVEESIYDDWSEAYDEIRSDINERRLSMILGS